MRHIHTDHQDATARRPAHLRQQLMNKEGGTTYQEQKNRETATNAAIRARTMEQRRYRGVGGNAWALPNRTAAHGCVAQSDAFLRAVTVARDSNPLLYARRYSPVLDAALVYTIARDFHLRHYLDRGDSLEYGSGVRAANRGIGG